MALTNAEKQRRYREKRDSDPNRRAEYLRKKVEKYRIDLDVGNRIPIGQMSQRGKRQQRKIWKEQQKGYRKRKGAQPEPLTPPTSPNPAPSHQQLSSARVRNRSKAKCYRDNAKLREELHKVNRTKHMYIKRWLRERERNKCDHPETPKSKSKRLLRGLRVNLIPKEKRIRQNQVRKTLTFHFALKEAIKEKYMSGSHRVKKTLAEMVFNGCVAKIWISHKNSQIYRDSE